MNLLIKIARTLAKPVRGTVVWKKCGAWYYGRQENKPLKRRIREYRNTPYAEQFKGLHNIHKGERCFIIGNGPSLRSEDLDSLTGEVTFASNYIYKIFDKTKWRPTYYCVSDQLGLKKILEDDEFYHIGAEMNFFIWKPFNNYVPNYESVSLPEPYCKFCLLPVTPNRKIGFSGDVHKFIYDANTVTYLLIQIAVYMGFKELYLLGIDHNYSSSIINGKRHETDTKDHFYSEKKADAGNPSLFSDIDSMTLGYRNAEKYSRRNGIRIYNATRGGKLEEFERADFDDIIFKTGG